MENHSTTLFEIVSTDVQTSLFSNIRSTNRELCTLLWRTGAQINKYLLHASTEIEKEQCVIKLSVQLRKKYGKLFTKKNMKNMILFANQFPEKMLPSVYFMAEFLSWSHICLLMKLNSRNQQSFYINLIISKSLSVAELKNEIKNNTAKYRDTKKDGAKSIFDPVKKGKDQLSWTLHNVSDSPNIYYNLQDEYFIEYLRLK